MPEGRRVAFTGHHNLSCWASIIRAAINEAISGIDATESSATVIQCNADCAPVIVGRYVYNAHIVCDAVGGPVRLVNVDGAAVFYRANDGHMTQWHTADGPEVQD